MATVRVLNNDAVYGSVVAFTYRALAGVDRLHPVAGVRFGGTLVTVHGHGFIGEAAARFAAARCDSSRATRLLKSLASLSNRSRAKRPSDAAASRARSTW